MRVSASGVCLCGSRSSSLPRKIFHEYPYFSSYSDSWVEHARVANAVARFGIGRDSLVIEHASNDGYLLQHVVARDIPTLGVEAAANVVVAARERGMETIVRFFGRDLARELVADGRAADLLVANNVMAHVPDLNDFVVGIARCSRRRECDDRGAASASPDRRQPMALPRFVWARRSRGQPAAYRQRGRSSRCGCG
jgi:hypothetical protein